MKYKENLDINTNYLMTKELVSQALGNITDDENIDQYIIELSRVSEQNITNYMQQIIDYLTKREFDQNDINIDELHKYIEEKRPQTEYFYSRQVSYDVRKKRWISYLKKYVKCNSNTDEKIFSDYVCGLINYFMLPYHKKDSKKQNKCFWFKLFILKL